MNHRLNARVNNLPECLECRALAQEPCMEHGRVREPHNVRLRMHSGEIIVTVRRDEPRAIVAAINQLRRAWHMPAKKAV